jgi:hypothetical protein
MDGQDLSVLLEGGEPEPRPHFSLCYFNCVWCEDDQYVMFARNDRAGPRLYDIGTDPLQQRNLADGDPATVKRMFEGYVLKDAGDRCPRSDRAVNHRRAAL